QVSVLVAAWRAGYDKTEALTWATSIGKVAERLADLAVAGPLRLTHQEWWHLRLRWTSDRANRWDDRAGLRAWYLARLDAGSPLSVTTRSPPSPPLWGLQWATTGTLGDIPEDAWFALDDTAVRAAAEITDRFPDMPLEILAWVAAERGGRLEAARLHADAF